MKPRSDAKLLNLPEEQQSKLVEWLLSGMAYHQVKSLLKAELGVSTSLGSLSAFYQECCVPHLLERRRQAVSVAGEIAREAEAQPGRWDAATMDALQQKALELSISPVANPKDVKALMMLVLKARSQDLEERRIALLEEKARRADEAEAVTKEDLSPEEKQQRMRQIFGLV